MASWPHLEAGYEQDTVLMGSPPAIPVPRTKRSYYVLEAGVAGSPHVEAGYAHDTVLVGSLAGSLTRAEGATAAKPP